MCSVRHIRQAGSREEVGTGGWLDRAKFPDRL